ncbi:MAG: DNA polymerase III subunit epsilon [Pseudohongiella sp.]|nr:DNA polymerase III subunit epsilon [Pseudohongiella sp.]
MRQIVLDTETTGLDPAQGHRIIEIGCVEIENRKLTGRHFHCYLNPDRDIDEAAIEVHGITRDFLADKPRFPQIEADFMEFVSGAELVIHNAPFDIGFLNRELENTDSEVRLMADYCTVLDTLLLARAKHPGQRNSLDAFCKRYEVDNTQRQLRGALLDAEILADVYLLMTSGQESLLLKEEQSEHSRRRRRAGKLDSNRPPIAVLQASQAELDAHRLRLQEIDDSSEEGCLWLQLETE